jgi:hypothetical protein
VTNYVVQPQDWDERGKGVKNDRLDALALCQRLVLVGSIGRWVPSVQHPLGFTGHRHAGILLHRTRSRRAGIVSVVLAFLLHRPVLFRLACFRAGLHRAGIIPGERSMCIRGRDWAIRWNATGGLMPVGWHDLFGILGFVLVWGWLLDFLQI